ncbi:MAG: hypothetical protein Q9163_001481 [Psora crenata]
MGFRADQLPGCLQQQHCQFPTTMRSHKHGSHFESVGVLKSGEETANWGRTPMQIRGLVQSAWASTLHSYIHEDSVCFAALSAIESCDSFAQGNEILSIPSSHTQILEYQVSNNLRLADIRPLGILSCDVEQLRKRQINTAIQHMTLLPLNDGKYNEWHFSVTNARNDHDLDFIVQNGHFPCGLSIKYRSPHIHAKYAQLIASTFRKIIFHFLNKSELQLGQLDVVGEDHRQQMKHWNPANPFGDEKNICMHHLIEARARVTPNSEAVCAWDGSLTYDQLNLLSDVVAEHLVLRSVGPGVYVPLAFEKSMWTIVAALAILKAGGAFVPVDPNGPNARLAEILMEVNARIVVTMEPFVSKFESLVQHVEVVTISTVSLDRSQGNLVDGTQAGISQRAGVKRSCTTNLDGIHMSAVGPRDPIFVLFTSGSTGKPKGMVHEHAAISTHATTHGDAMGYQGARVLQFAAYTFDVAIIDIFTTLLFGGCVCVPSEEDRRDNIIRVINDMKVDYAILTPSFAGLIEPSEVPTLKTLAIGGEPLPQERIERWSEKVKLIQIYGPAEVGICLTQYMKSSTPPENIGYPLRNSSCWLVDADDSDKLVPIGAVGELVVAGPSLARGYLNNPMKTESSFIDPPLWATEMHLPFSRFYKTGDLLRYNTACLDGSFDFIGRKDLQIKLRGQRIEPGEVEYHIGQFPGVAVSMVTLPNQGCFAGELVAVMQMLHFDTKSTSVRNAPIRLSIPQPLTIESITEHLSRHLPGYMIPTICLVIDNMPFVPSMKIDRRALSTWLTNLERESPQALSPAFSRLAASEGIAHAISQKVADLVSSKQIPKQSMLPGRDFRLHDIGLDSVQIMSLSMFLQREYGKQVSFHTLLSSRTTVRELASLVEYQSTLLGQGQSPSSAISQLDEMVDVRQEIDVLSTQLFQSMKLESVQTEGRTYGLIQNIFLTGATGYLGSAILQQLLALSDIHIYTLVRCSTPLAGLQRIIASAASSGWWRDAYTPRIHVWQGDLTKRNLGLGNEELQILHGRTETPHDKHIHAIIHNGAKVHYSTDYTNLKSANVLSTIFVLETTARNPYVSRLVFVSGGEKPNLDCEVLLTAATTDSHLASLNHASGYTQSKFVSEHLVRHCANNPLYTSKRLHIVKPGYIVGSLADGRANQSDFIWRLVAGCVEMGAFNRDELEHWLFINDVDAVAETVVSGLFDDTRADGLHGYASGHVERVLDGLTFRDLWDLMGVEFGYQLEALGQDAWVTKLRERVLAVGESHGLFPLLHVLETAGGHIGEKMGGVGDVERVKEVVRSNIRYLIDVAFLPEPNSNGKR